MNRIEAARRQLGTTTLSETQRLYTLATLCRRLDDRITNRGLIEQRIFSYYYASWQSGAELNVRSW